jgi:hypothetical protein
MGDQEEARQQPTEESASKATGSTAEPEPEPQEEPTTTDKDDGTGIKPASKYEG